MRGLQKPLILVFSNRQEDFKFRQEDINFRQKGINFKQEETNKIPDTMITKENITAAVNEWLQNGDYFLVDVEINADGRIVIEIDCAEGVWIEDCADLSRHLQETLGEELDDYELEVGSAGIGQPFKVVQQYRNHIGKQIEVMTADGKKLQGVMKSVSDDGTQFTATVKEKQHVEGKKRPVMAEVDHTFAIADVKYCKYLLTFK